MFLLLIQIIAAFIDVSTGLVIYNWIWIFPLFPTLESIRVLTLIPFLAVLTRRLHDRDMSTSYMFMIFIPVFGFFWLLPHLITEGTKETNRFGNVFS